MMETSDEINKRIDEIKDINSLKKNSSLCGDL